MPKIKVLYEDNHLIAVFKPAGVLAQGDKSGRDSILEEVKDFLKKRDGKTGNVFLGLLHRLDTPVSGIMLFAKTSKGAGRLSEQFRNRTIEKKYQAVVEGILKEKTGELVNFLKKDEKENKVEESSESEGVEAVLEYEVKKEKGDFSLLEIRPLTGRSHQIRFQLASIGHPIAGDQKYGSKIKIPDRSIFLCAMGLEFETATTGERKKIEIEYPEEWNNFLNKRLLKK